MPRFRPRSRQSPYGSIILSFSYGRTDESRCSLTFGFAQTGRPSMAHTVVDSVASASSPEGPTRKRAPHQFRSVSLSIYLIFRNRKHLCAVVVCRRFSSTGLSTQQIRPPPARAGAQEYMWSKAIVVVTALVALFCDSVAAANCTREHVYCIVVYCIVARHFCGPRTCRERYMNKSNRDQAVRRASCPRGLLHGSVLASSCFLDPQQQQDTAS
jgi:hypothetical protein